MGRCHMALSIIPRTSGRLLVWDVTCTDTFFGYNLSVAINQPVAMAEKVEQLKSTKNSLDSSYLFNPVAIETNSVFGPESMHFIRP